MTPGQFHLEAELSERVATRQVETRLSDQASDAGIVSLLIGVATRGWLTDHEKEFLDSLVPSHSISFLTYDGQYLHPEAVPLLNPEQLEASYLQENAVYSHRQRLVSGSFTSSRVHAARLGELTGKQLTFGMVGQDRTGLFDHTGDNFAILVGRFRKAVEGVRPAVERIMAVLSSTTPALLVNRCSGRVIAVNSAVTTSNDGEHSKTIDAEFSACKNTLNKLLDRHLMHAENLRVGDIDLSLISFTPRQTKAGDLAGEMYPKFIESLRRATQALHSTAHHLEGIITWQPGHPESELLRLIHEETTELEQIVHRYQLLTVFGQLRAEKVNPADELRKTVTHAAIHHPSRQLTMTEQWSSRVELNLPTEALAVLYETILEVHLTSSGCMTTTSVALDADPSGLLEISFETTSPHATAHLHCSSDWSDYIESLGRLLGFTVHHRFAGGTRIETILTHHKDSRTHE